MKPRERYLEQIDHAVKRLQDFRNNVIDCPNEDWTPTGYRLMEILLDELSHINHVRGFIADDMQRRREKTDMLDIHADNEVGRYHQHSCLGCMFKEEEEGVVVCGIEDADPIDQMILKPDGRILCSNWEQK